MGDTQRFILLSVVFNQENTLEFCDFKNKMARLTIGKCTSLPGSYAPAVTEHFGVKSSALFSVEGLFD